MAVAKSSPPRSPTACRPLRRSTTCLMTSPAISRRFGTSRRFLHLGPGARKRRGFFLEAAYGLLLAHPTLPRDILRVRVAGGLSASCPLCSCGDPCGHPLYVRDSATCIRTA